MAAKSWLILTALMLPHAHAQNVQDLQRCHDLYANQQYTDAIDACTREVIHGISLPVTMLLNIHLHQQTLPEGPEKTQIQQVFQKTLQDLQNRAQDGDPEAHTILGIHLQRGIFWKANPEEARKHFEAARDAFEKAGNLTPVQQNTLGMLYRRGFFDDPGKSFQLHLQAAQQGNPYAQGIVAFMYESSTGTKADPEQTFLWYTRSANAGYSTAIRNLGDIYEKRGDFNKAFSLYQQAANLHHWTALTDLARFHQEGLLVPKDAQKAFELNLQAARQWFDPAMLNVADRYLTGLGTPRNLQESQQWYGRTLWQHDLLGAGFLQPPSVFRLAVALKDGGLPTHYARAVELFRWSAQKGNLAAHLQLGGMYEYGLGVKQDHSKAIEHYTLGKALPENLVELGYMHQQGWGVPADPFEAQKFYLEARSKGLPRASTMLGNLYLNLDGKGFPRDPQKALAYYQEAASQGDLDAQNNLGWMHHRGIGGPRDDLKARMFFEGPALAGYSHAQSNLGNLYFTAAGTEKNDRLAREWYEKAVAGDPRNVFALTNLGYVLSQAKDPGVLDYPRAFEVFTLAAQQGYTPARQQRALMMASGMLGEVNLERALEEALLGGVGLQHPVFQGFVQQNPELLHPHLKLLAGQSSEVQFADPGSVTLMLNFRNPSREEVTFTAVVNGETLPLEVQGPITRFGPVALKLSLPDSFTEGQVTVQVRNSAGAGNAVTLHLRRNETQPRQGVLRVLTVGVNQPASGIPGLKSLQYAVQDAEALGAALKEHFKASFENIQVQTLTGEQATRKNVLAALEDLRLNARSEDRTVVFFATHGLVEDGQYQLLLADTTGQDVPGSALSAGQLRVYLQTLQSPALFLLDACRAPRENNTLTSTAVYGSSTDLLRDTLIPTGDVPKTVMLATQPQQVAFEKDAWQHGVFTYALLLALKEGKASTVYDWFSQTSRTVTELTSKLGLQQTPEVLGDNWTFDEVNHE